jgi:hypothetical protein
MLQVKVLAVQEVEVLVEVIQHQLQVVQELLIQVVEVEVEHLCQR